MLLYYYTVSIASWIFTQHSGIFMTSRQTCSQVTNGKRIAPLKSHKRVCSLSNFFYTWSTRAAGAWLTGFSWITAWTRRSIWTTRSSWTAWTTWTTYKKGFSCIFYSENKCNYLTILHLTDRGLNFQLKLKIGS